MEARLLEELMDAITTDRGVDRKVVQEEALRLYLNTNPGFKLDGAVVLWRRGRVTLANAAEIAGLTVPEFKEVLAARGIVRETEGKSGEEMAEKLKAVWT